MVRVHSSITLEISENLDVEGESLEWASPCRSVSHQGIVIQVLTQSYIEDYKVE